MNAGLVETESAAAYAARAVAWDSKEHLELALPFQDLKPTIFLGTVSIGIVWYGVFEISSRVYMCFSFY